MTHDIGDLVTLRVSFTNEANEPVDGTVTCTVIHPDDSTSAPAVTNPAIGRYQAQVTPDAGGVWRFRFVSVGLWVAAESGYFEVVDLTAGLNEQRFRARVRRLTAYDYEPKLTDADIDDLVEMSRRPDALGRLPSETGWIPTYDLAVAVSNGWETKAARAAGDFRFEEDNQVFYREQVADHCMKMAKRWNRRMVTTRI